jgi:hypothetical protein
VRSAAAELRPLTRPAALTFLFLLLGGACDVAAQNAADLGASPDQRAHAAAEIAATRLFGEWVPLAGGSLTFRLGRRFEIGGATRFGLSSATLAGGSRLHFGYAGARFTILPAPSRWSGARVGLLLAGGNADVRDPAVGAVVDSDNGAVLEPSASYSRTLAPRVAATAALSWRYATGFRLIGDVLSRDLRGPAAAFAIAVGPF